MIERRICEAVFHEAVVACDPALRVREALDREPLRGRTGVPDPSAARGEVIGRPRVTDPSALQGEVIGLAIGKAALAMARGAGPVTRGIVVTPHGDERIDATHVPAGWVLIGAGHPMPDENSLAAGALAIRMIESATPDDVVLSLISGGASSLVEQPAEGVTFEEFRERIRTLMASGAPIHEINRVRTELSALKGGKLAARCKAPVVTLVVSDVIGDDPRVIGSGPTVRDGQRVEIVAPMATFGEEIVEALHARGIEARRIAEPIAGDVAVVADQLAREPGVVVAWGEPTVRVPDDHGVGGRAQQLALELARLLRGSPRSAFVAGSDGIDGPSARGAAGAYVDGATWEAIAAMKLDPARALARCDAGTVLDAVGALVVTGPTGINHADVVIVG